MAVVTILAFLIYKLLQYFLILLTFIFLPSFESNGLSVQEKCKIDFQIWWPSWISDQNNFISFLSTSCPRYSYFLPSFESIGLSVQEKKGKIDLQDGSHLGFPIRTILAISDLQIALYFLPSFKSIGLWVLEKLKIDFQDGGHFGYQIQIILAIFALHVTLLFPTKFGVSWPFGSVEVQNRFLRWWPWGAHLGFWVKTMLAIFDLQVTLILPISTILAIFDLQFTVIIPTKFQVNCPFCSEVQNRFSKRLPWQHSWRSDWNNFSNFELQVTIILPTNFRVSWSLGSGHGKIDFQDGYHDGHLGFPIGMILAIYYLQIALIFPTKFRVNLFVGSGDEG